MPILAGPVFLLLFLFNSFLPYESVYDTPPAGMVILALCFLPFFLFNYIFFPLYSIFPSFFLLLLLCPCCCPLFLGVYTLLGVLRSPPTGMPVLAGPVFQLIFLFSSFFQYDNSNIINTPILALYFAPVFPFFDFFFPLMSGPFFSPFVFPFRCCPLFWAPLGVVVEAMRSVWAPPSKIQQ